MHAFGEVLGLAGQHLLLQGSSPPLPGGRSLEIIIRIIISLESIAKNPAFSAGTSLVPGSAMNLDSTGYFSGLGGPTLPACNKAQVTL